MLLAGLLFTAGCKKDVTTVNSSGSGKPAAGGSISDMLAKKAPPVQTFTFSNEAGTTITGARGTTINIEPYTYGSSAGAITLKLTEVYTKNEMAAAGIFTEAEGDRMLKSQGMFEVKATRNGIEVLPEKESNITMKIDSATTPANTKVFKLEERADSMQKIKKVWVEYDKNWDYDSSNTSRCHFKFKLLSWCNLDAYLDYSINSQLKVKLPDGFGSINSMVYFNLTGVNGLVTMYPDYAGKQFVSLMLKAGYKGTVIIVSEKDSKYYRKVIDVTIKDEPQTFEVASLDEATFDEVDKQLESF